MKKLEKAFFNRSTLRVAEELLGKVLVFKDHKGIITETEAYMGFDDPASHAFRGVTPRTQLMFGEPGFSYVYLIYGIYHCLNFVTEEVGFPAAVLIRGLYLLDGSGLHLNGPGKICRHLGISKEHNGLNLVSGNTLWVACMNQKLDFSTTSRIGIKVGTDKLWRFLAKDFKRVDEIYEQNTVAEKF